MSTWEARFQVNKTDPALEMVEPGPWRVVGTEAPPKQRQFATWISGCSAIPDIFAVRLSAPDKALSERLVFNLDTQ